MHQEEKNVEALRHLEGKLPQACSVKVGYPFRRENISAAIVGRSIYRFGTRFEHGAAVDHTHMVIRIHGVDMILISCPDRRIAGLSRYSH